jgi:phenylpropionate dioxygenase-like ring-hydroxylating dioxygenase large terminal subunit
VDPAIRDDALGDGAIDVALARCWHPVAVSSEVGAAPQPVRLLGRDLVVARLDGVAVAFDDRCPHRGAAVSLGWVDDGCLVCPYHGWTYGADGACVLVPTLGREGRVPARAALTRRHVREHLGLVWVALEDPVAELPVFPELDDAGIRIVPCPPYDWGCHAVRRVENFLDFAHFPWIHPGILGDRDAPQVAPFTVARAGDRIDVHQLRTEPTNDDVKTMGLALDGVVTSDMRYVVQLPLTAQLRQDLPGGRTYVVWLAASPVDATTTRTFWFVGRNYALDEDDDKYVRFQQDVVAQDRPVIESQRPIRPPLSVSAELAVRDDKLLLEFRRGLVELAARAGVAPG